MNEMDSILSEPAVDQILRNLVVSNRKWTDVTADILEVERKTGAASAEAFVVQAAQGLIGPSHSSISNQETKEDTDIRKGLDVLRQRHSVERSTAFRPSVVMNWFLERLLLRGDVSFNDYSSNRFFSQLVDDSYNARTTTICSEDVEIFLKQCADASSLTATLTAVYTLLMLKVETPDMPMNANRFGALFATLGKSSLLSREKFDEMLQLILAVDNMKIFQSSPRLLPITDTSCECLRYEMRGEGISVLNGFDLSAVQDYFYCEVAFRGKRTSSNGVRVGFSTKTFRPKSVNELGSALESWILDISTGKFLHDDPDALSMSANDQSVSLPEPSDDDFFGDLFGDDDCSSDDIALQNSAESKSSGVVKVVELWDIQSAGKKWRTPRTLSLALNIKSGDIHFYSDGEYAGTAFKAIDVLQVMPNTLTLILSSNASTTCELNIGQSPFRFDTTTMSDLSLRECDESVSSLPLSVAFKSSPSSYLSFKVQNRMLGDFPLIKVQNLVKDAPKSLTVEMSIKIISSGIYSSDGSGKQLSRDFVLFSCSQGEEATNRSSINEGGCLIGVSNYGSFFFELQDSIRINTPPCALKFGHWCHLSVSYTFHRSTNSADVTFYVNGTVIHQSEIAGSRSLKLNKLFAKSVAFGLPSVHNKNLHSFDVIDICNIRLWSSSRSNDRVASLMHRDKLLGNEVELLCFLPCLEGQGSVVHDLVRSKGNGSTKCVAVNRFYDWQSISVSVDDVERWFSRVDEIRTPMALSDSSLSLDSGIASVLRQFFDFAAVLNEVDQIDDIIYNQQPGFATWVNPTLLNFRLLASIANFILESSLVQSSISTQLIEALAQVLCWNMRFFVHRRSSGVSPDDFSDVDNDSKIILFRLVFALIETKASHGVTMLIDNLEFFFSSSESMYQFLFLLLSRNRTISEVSIVSALEGLSLQNSVVGSSWKSILGCVKSLSDAHIDSCISQCCSKLVTWKHVQTFRKLNDFRVLWSKDSMVSNLAQGRSCSTQNILRHGSFVRRGPHWQYGDEDGGVSSVGVVVEVRDWFLEKDCGAVVVWSNGSMDKYRYGAIATNGSRLFDISVIEMDASDCPIQLPLSKKLCAEKPLKYSANQLREHLLPSDGTQASGQTISKEAVLEYVLATATSTWLSFRGLTSVNSQFATNLSNLELCKLYKDFENEFGPDDSMESGLSRLVSLLSSSEYDSLSSLLTVALLEWKSNRGGSHVVTQLLSGIQYAVFATDQILQVASPNSMLGPTSTFELNDRSAFYNEFEDGLGRQLKWSFIDGSWVVTKAAPPVVDSSVKQSSRESTIVHAKIIARFTFEKCHFEDEVVVRTRSRYCEVTAVGEGDCSSFLADMPLKPDTGNYVWYVKVKTLSPNSRMMFGISLANISSSDFLGEDAVSCGLSQNFEFVSAGCRYEFADGRTMKEGSILEISFDTSTGQLRYLELGSDNSLLAMNLEGFDSEAHAKKHYGKTVYPAFSLCRQRDSFLLVTDSDEIKQLRGKFTKLSSNIVTKSKQSINCIYPGAPPLRIVNYVVQTVPTMASFLDIQKFDLRNDDNVLYFLLFILSMLNKWTAPITCRLDTVKSVLSQLLELIGNLLSTSASMTPQSMEMLNQLQAVVVSILGKLTLYYLRSDRFVPYNEILLATNAVNNPEDKTVLMSICNSQLVVNGLRKHETACSTFISSIQQNSSLLNPVLDQLDLHLKSHSVEAKARNQGLADDTATSQLFLVFVYHLGMVSSLRQALQENLSRAHQSHLLSSLTMCWKAAINCRISLDVSLAQATDSRLLESLFKRIKFALGLEQMVEESDFYDNYAHSQFGSEDVAAMELSSLALSHKSVTPKMEHAISAVGTFLMCSVDADSLVGVFNGIDSAARLRCDGFKLIKSVMDILSSSLFQDIKALYLHQVSMATKGLYCNWIRHEYAHAMSELRRRDSCWYYLDSLQCASKELKRDLRGSFNSLITTLVADLSSAELTTGIYQLSLLGMLAVRMEIADHELLSKVNLFFTLQELLENLLMLLSSGDQAQIDACKAADVLLAALKVFIFIGMQIATFGQDETAFVRSVTLEFCAPELHKVKSGPATLNNAVFNILFDFLTAFKANSTILENKEVLEECVGLLLCVSKHPECRKILCKSKWVVLILDLIACTSNSIVMERLLLVLSDILLAVDLADFKWDSTAEDQAEIPSQDLVDRLLMFCGRQAQRLSASFSKKQGQNNFGVVCECCSLIRKLASTPMWRSAFDVAITKSLSSALSPETKESLVGALVVIGGPLEMFYPSCPVRVILDKGAGSGIGVVKGISTSADSADISFCRIISPDSVDGAGVTTTYELSAVANATVPLDDLQPLHWPISFDESFVVTMLPRLISVAAQYLDHSTRSDSAPEVDQIQCSLVVVHALNSIASLMLSRSVTKAAWNTLASSDLVVQFAAVVIESAKVVADVGSIADLGYWEQYLVSLISNFNSDDDSSNTEAARGGEADSGSSPVVETLVNMGFPRKLCVVALQICGGDPGEALNYMLTNGSALMDIISKQEARDAGRNGQSERNKMNSKEKPGKAAFYSKLQSSVHPYFVTPSLDAERVGVIFPGDQIQIVEEKVISDKLWFRVPLVDVMKQGMPSFKDLNNIYVWIPAFRGDLVVIDSEKVDSVSPTTHVDLIPLEPLQIRRRYRVIGANGALVRSQVELSSEDVATLEFGTIVHSDEESVNQEGTLRLRISYPCNGWISKIPGLLERIPDQSSMELYSGSVGVMRPEVAMLADVEDNFEVLTGVDAFVKESRFFGNLQGSENAFAIENKSVKGARTTSKRKRVCGSNSFAAMFKSTSKIDSCASVVSAVEKMKALYCRQILFIAVERILLQQSTCDVDVTSPSMLFDRVFAHLTPSTLLRILRLTMFRGTPTQCHHRDSLRLTNLQLLSRLDSSACLEDSILNVMPLLFRYASQDWVFEFWTLALDCVARNLREACDSKYSDFSWLSVTYEDDIDKDILSQPNLHCCLWITHLLIQEFEREDSLNLLQFMMESLQVFLLSLRGTSMSMKYLSFKTVSKVLDSIRTSTVGRGSVVTELLKSQVSLSRMNVCVARRLWTEMEDSPVFSRFLQAFVEFSLEINMLEERSVLNSSLLDGEEAPTSSGKALVMNKPTSSIKLQPQKDLQGCWTMEVWLMRRRIVSEQHTPFQVKKGDIPGKKAASGSSSGLGNEKKSLSSYLQLLLGKEPESRTSTSTVPNAANDSLCWALQPEYLLSSSKAFIKIQKGGRNYELENIDDPAQAMSFVSDESRHFSVGTFGQDEKVFDYSVPYDKWVHLAVVNDPRKNTLSLYENGALVDSLQGHMQFPIAVMGSTQIGQSFGGAIQDVKVWGFARSQQEIERNMHRDWTIESEIPELVVHLVPNHSSHDLLFDRKTFIVACKATDCTLEDQTPFCTESHLKSTLLTESLQDNLLDSDMDGKFELTGYVNIPPLGQKAPLNAGLREIVVIAFKMMNSSNARLLIEGYVDWNERGAKTLLTGSLCWETEEIEFVSKGADVVFGAPESLHWLNALRFSGKFNKQVLSGSCTASVRIESTLIEEPGTIRLDLGSLPRQVAISDVNKCTTFTVREEAPFGQYLVFFHVSPFKATSDDESDVQVVHSWKGIKRDQGSIWIEFLISASAGDIAFGWTTADALVHPDASVDANDGTWTYSTAGQSSHGGNLFLSDTAESGDRIGLQLNADVGIVRFFKNDTLVAEFLDLLLHDDMVADKLGVRPFINLVCETDSVSLVGPKSGYTEIQFSEEDSQCRASLYGFIDKASINGPALLRMQDDMDGGWFGIWSQDCPTGLHIHVESVDTQDLVVTSVRDYGATLCADFANFETVSTESAEHSNAILAIKSLFAEFRSKVDLLANSVFAEVASEPASESGSEVNSDRLFEDSGELLSLSIVDSSATAVVMNARKNLPLNTVLSEYSQSKHNCPGSSFVFSLATDSIELDSSKSPVELGFVSDVQLKAVTRSFKIAEGATVEDPVDQYFSNSSAKFIVQVIYESGATVRDGVEIEDCAALRTISNGEIVESFQKSFTSEGIGRYRIPDGWISEKLRGRSDTLVIRLFRELFPLESLPSFVVVRDGGIKARSAAIMASSDLGMIPMDKVLTIAERRLVFSSEDNNWTTRLRIESPAEFKGMWISDKVHLIKEISDSSRNSEGADPSFDIELKRRAKLRIMRQTKQITEKGQRKNFRICEVQSVLVGSAETFFLLKKSKHTDSVKFSPDFTSIKSSDAGGRTLVLGSRGFSHGVHYWEVEVKAASWGSVFIGVAPEECSGWNGFGLINYRATQAFGAETLYGTYFSVNDKVGVLLDMDRGTLSFFKDGEDFNYGKVVVINMGVAYHNLRKITGRHSSSQLLFPCFGVKSGGDELCIKNCHWQSTRGFNSQSMLSRLMSSMKIIHEWQAAVSAGRSLAFPRDIVTELYAQYCKKCNPNEIFSCSRAGLPLRLSNANDDVFRLIGKDFALARSISIGCRLKTVYGKGSLIGVSGNRLWYSCDSNANKAWYWLPEEFISLLSDGVIGIESDVDSLSPTVSKGGGSGTSMPPTEQLPQQAFESLLSRPWNARDEESFVQLINHLSSHLDRDPSQLSIAQLSHHLKQKAHVNCDRQDAYIVRYIALCLLNKAVSIALPLVDLSLARERKLLTMTSLSHFDESRRGHSSLLASPIRQSLLSIKRSVFTATKLDFWQFAVKETTTPTAAPADEYERPEEIREISINRISARNSLKLKNSLSFSEKQKLSVFGQLMSSLSNWDERSLRRSYVHMQDAGQSRCFFVKFVGEGVDDQGGPYRAVFQTAFGEEISELLELVVPCANAVDEIGENRDKTVFNTELDKSQHSKLFVQLGKMVGMAARHKILLPLMLAPLIWKSLVGDVIGPDDLRSIDSSVSKSIDWLIEATDIENEQKHDLLMQIVLNSTRQCGIGHHLRPSVIDELLSRALSQSVGSESSLGEDSDLSIERIVQLVQYLRLMSQNSVLQSFYSGLAEVVPVELLSIFSAGELETVVCGESELDIDVLKRVAVYESVSPLDSHIQYFWQALEELDTEERSQFVNFCSGRSRLPTSASEFLMPFKLTAPQSNAEADPDKYLPIARTCFFSLSIPKYSSTEVCLAKLRYAINNTELMDADFIDRRGTSAWDNVA